MSIEPTFRGYIETTQDTLLIFEACRRMMLTRICRRLQEKERKIVSSGSVFVFDERESGIKRWTDGLVWSPSRILGNFLIYRELDKRAPAGKKDSSPVERQRSNSTDMESQAEKNKERALVGSLTNSYRFKKGGLIKKTMSIMVNGVSQHMISYYTKEDVMACKLKTPSSIPSLAILEIAPEFLLKQNFRIPPVIESTYEQGEQNSPSMMEMENSTTNVEIYRSTPTYYSAGTSNSTSNYPATMHHPTHYASTYGTQGHHHTTISNGIIDGTHSTTLPMPPPIRSFMNNRPYHHDFPPLNASHINTSATSRLTTSHPNDNDSTAATTQTFNATINPLYTTGSPYNDLSSSNIPDLYNTLNSPSSTASQSHHHESLSTTPPTLPAISSPINTASTTNNNSSNNDPATPLSSPNNTATIVNSGNGGNSNLFGSNYTQYYQTLIKNEGYPSVSVSSNSFIYDPYTTNIRNDSWEMRN
ncbi:10436_t:CDS:2 [Diversispora eburnea]|uniref:10436_t:CDS:1 n=1 Tax=Diversispora eburnea TaxID=1213867 RepID=A0A9N9BZ91_9GLOM|nr:10436_t:CDS:2 [Diversispora eburnea]